MTYNPNIPQAGTKIKNTYNLVQTNFFEADRIFNIDHFGFSNLNLARQGKHQCVRLVRFAAGGPPTTAEEIALFSGNVGGFTELFLKRQGSPPTSIPMTCKNITPSFAANQGESFIPGGFVIKWGFVVPGLGVDTGTVTFTSPFTGPNGCYGVNLSINAVTPLASASFTVVAHTVGPASFTWRTSTPNIKFFWTAIGF